MSQFGFLLYGTIGTQQHKEVAITMELVEFMPLNYVYTKEKHQSFNCQVEFRNSSKSTTPSTQVVIIIIRSNQVLMKSAKN